MRGTRKVLIVAVAALAAAALFAGASSAVASKPATTGTPGTYAVVVVKLGDKGLTVSRHQSVGVQVLGFRIRNVGKLTHNFIIGSHATNPIKPGQFDDFAVNFQDYGKYLYRCTLHCPKTARGYINVKAGTATGG